MGQNLVFFLLITALLVLPGCDRPEEIGSSARRKALQEHSVDSGPAPPRTLPNVRVIESERVYLSSQHPLTVSLLSSFPKGYSFNEQAPSSFALYLSEGERQSDAQRHLVQEGRLHTSGFFTTLEPLPGLTEGSLLLQATIYYCRKDGEGSCLIRSFEFWQPFRLVSAEDSPPLPVRQNTIEFNAKLSLPKNL